MASTTIRELRARIEGLRNIPANEQCLGHFQRAIEELLQDMLEHIEKLEKVVGIHAA